MLRVLALLILLTSSLSAAEVVEITGQTMGTTYSVKWVETDNVAAEDLKAAVDERLVAINRMMSTYDPESELSRFNTSNTTDWFDVSPQTATVVAKALEVARLSDGAFDPTVGRLVRMWSFGSGDRSYAPPPDEELQTALEHVGYRKIEVRTDPPALRKTDPQAELDLSAIAKGFGVDAVSGLLTDRGLINHLVEIGGEVRAQGTKNGQAWRLGIERPTQQRSGLAATVALHDQSLATSGDYRNFFVRDGRRYSHTIDPRTGRPVEHSLASVSIVTDDCMSADAWATTLMVLGPEKGLQLADQQKLAAYLLIHEGQEIGERASLAGATIFDGPAGAVADVGPGPGTMVLMTILVFGLAMAGLAIGVILSNRRLQGSCGGLSGMRDDQGRPMCGSCSIPPEQCDEFRKSVTQSGTAPATDD